MKKLDRPAMFASTFIALNVFFFMHAVKLFETKKHPWKCLLYVHIIQTN